MSIEVIQAIVTALVPLLFLLIPGVFIVSLSPKESLFVKTAKVILASLTVTILLSLLVAAFRLPIYTAGVLIVVFSCLELWHKRSLYNRSFFQKLLFPVAAFLLLYVSLSIPWLNFHQGLPTGDSQKAIFWAQQIIDYNRLPDYSISQAVMNRDPVDFYTPGLHAYTALIMQLSPHPLMAVGFMSLTLTIAAAFIAAGIALTVFSRYRLRAAVAFFTVLGTLTHFRFLRYATEPGYHLQNIAGEVLLFGLLFLGLRLLNRLRWLDGALFVMTAAALLFTHQLSAFLAGFLAMPIILLWIWHHRFKIIDYIKHHHSVWIALGIFAGATFFLLFNLNLHQKINHIFTTSPHLLPLTLSPLGYLPMMGSIWLLGGLLGLALLWTSLVRKYTLVLSAFVLAVTLLFILSQGPRLGINIPPVRTLFYSIIPLSICAGYFLTAVIDAVNRRYRFTERFISFGLITAIVASSAYSSLANAYNLSHGVRTNSTMTAGQQHLIDFLRKEEVPKTVLIDDYNRRSSSWLLLGAGAMYTRIAADMQRQMNEAHQSPVRYNLYLALLDYEKIFSMGSSPAIADLMTKHGITYVTGITKTSATAFAQNPALYEAARSHDIILYGLKEEAVKSPYLEDINKWLLKATTLTNNIGDRQDTFAHLPASIPATRLSEPQADSDKTWRTSSAPYIPLQFNIGHYALALYDKENTGYADTALELLVDFATNNSETVEIITPSGKRLPLNSKELLKIPSKDAPWDDRGFISLVIYNPSEEPINIYFVALGLARTP